MRTALETEALRRLYMREERVLLQRIESLDLLRVGLLEKLAAKRAQLDATRQEPPAQVAPIAAE